MKLIALIALFAVGVASEAEVTSAAPQLTTLQTTSSSTFVATLPQTEETNRRDGVSYSSSVIHRDPNYPDKDAESSINFRLNSEPVTKQKEASHTHAYTTPKYHDYQLSGEHVSQSAPEEDISEQNGRQPQEDVVYGHNVVSGPPPSYQNYPRAESQDYRNDHPNHQPYYKPIAYAQPTFTEAKHKTETQHPTTQYKHTTTIHKTLSTPRPRTTPNFRGPLRYHALHGQHSQHSPSIHHGQLIQHTQHSQTTSHSHPTPSKLTPQAQPYTQIIYKPDPPQSDKPISTPSSIHGQSQSFNVGYSVKFGNDPNGPKKSFKAIRPDSDIITGSPNEEVRKPSHVHFPQDDKKYTFSVTNPQQVLSEANLTPKTQKQLAFLENIQSHKFIQKEPVQSNFPWKNLSPSVEIYRSKEISLPGTPKNSYGFDHEKAMGKSEGFDYSNAVEYMQKIQQAQASQTQLQGYLADPETETQAHNRELRQQIEAQVPYHQVSDSGQPPLPKLPIDTSLLREPFLTVHQERINPQDAQLPIHFDTSLIKEMSGGYGNIYADDYPGHPAAQSETSEQRFNFQDSLAQINNLIAEQSQHNSRYQQLAPSAPSEQEQGIILLHREQMPVQQPKSKELETTYAYPQNGLFNPNLQNHLQGFQTQKPADFAQPLLYVPNSGVKHIDPQSLKHLKMYKVKEYVRDHVQPQQYKFKVFGKQGNIFMRHQYEKMRHDRPVRMQSQPTNAKRYVRDYTNIEMDLRPPPMTMPFKTSNFLRIKQ